MQLAVTETAMRRPTFEPGIAIKLDDGQEWEFPRPRVKWRMVLREDVRVLAGRTHFGPEFDEMRERLNAAENDGDYLMASFTVAAWLLRRNYDLTEAEALDLLAYDTEDEANQSAWESIYDVVWARAPKPSAGGEA
jgi:hypothetical protein